VHFANIQEILDFAVKREEEAARAYADLQSRTRSQSLKKLLAELENDEKRHKELLLGLTGVQPSSLTVSRVPDLKISDYLIAEPASGDMTFQDLLILAAKKEQKAVDLYGELRGLVSDTEHKKLFEFLMMQEQSHKLRLETEYDKHVMTED
jgi:rubrerythrin